MEAKEIKTDALGREVKDLSTISWWGLDRKSIEWYPKIDYDKCIRCGVCFISCGRRVFDWNIKDDKPIVARPYNCMVACQTCANICPCNAIEFPDLRLIKRLSGKAKIVKKAIEKIKEITVEEQLDAQETEIRPNV